MTVRGHTRGSFGHFLRIVGPPHLWRGYMRYRLFLENAATGLTRLQGQTAVGAARSRLGRS